MDSNLTPPLIISTIALFAVIYVVVQVIVDLNLYTKDSGFPRPTVFFIGTLVSFYALGLYVAVARTKMCDGCPAPASYLLASSLFYLFYWIFTLNLTIRAEYYVNGARLPTTTGAFWLFLGILVLLFLFAYDRCTPGLWLLIIPVIWSMYLMYNWMYKI